MRLLDSAYLPQYVRVGEAWFKLTLDGGQTKISKRKSTKPKLSFGGSYMYWPETIQEVYDLVATHAGLRVHCGHPGRLDTMMWGHSALVIENHTYAEQHWPGALSELTCSWTPRRATAGIFYGYRFLDGGKWSRSIQMRDQVAQAVLIPYEWLDNLDRTITFHRGVDGSVAPPSKPTTPEQL
jgi:hypothetical protein